QARLKLKVPTLGVEVCFMRASPIVLMVVLAVVMALSSNVTAQPIGITYGPVIENLNSNQATIAWTTRQPSDSRVWYGTEKGNLTKVAEAPANGNTHRVQI